MDESVDQDPSENLVDYSTTTKAASSQEQHTSRMAEEHPMQVLASQETSVSRCTEPVDDSEHCPPSDQAQVERLSAVDFDILCQPTLTTADVILNMSNLCSRTFDTRWKSERKKSVRPLGTRRNHSVPVNGYDYYRQYRLQMASGGEMVCKKSTNFSDYSLARRFVSTIRIRRKSRMANNRSAKVPEDQIILDGDPELEEDEYEEVGLPSRRKRTKSLTVRLITSKQEQMLKQAMQARY